MEFIIAGLLSTALCLILKMVMESKKQIDVLLEELEDIQLKIEDSLVKNVQRKDHQCVTYLQSTVLANGETETHIPPYTSADQN